MNGVTHGALGRLFFPSGDCLWYLPVAAELVCAHLEVITREGEGWSWLILCLRVNQQRAPPPVDKLEKVAPSAILGRPAP